MNGRLDEAEASLLKALEIDPDFMLGQLSLSELYTLTGKYVQADSLYQMFVESPDPSDHSFGRELLVRPLLHQGRFQEALKMLEVNARTDSMASGESRFLARSRYQRGYIYEMYLRDLDRALAEYQAAGGMVVRVLPGRQPECMGSMARIHAKKGNLDSAEMILREVDSLPMVQQRPHISWEVHGQIELAWSNHATAVTLFERLEAMNPRHFEYKRLLGRAYYGADNLGDAVTMFEEALPLYLLDHFGPVDARVLLHYDLGLAYEASGWSNKAIEQYETFLDIWKNADVGLAEVEDARQRLTRLQR